MGEYDGFLNMEYIVRTFIVIFLLLRFWHMDSRNLPVGRLEENGDAAALREIELFSFPVCGSTVLLN